MNRALRVVSAPLLLAFVLSGCTVEAKGTTPTVGTTATTGSTAASRVLADPEDGADVGNDRPRVTYDGLMVRRRVVIAIQSTPDADLVSLRKEMDNAATSRHTSLSTMSPSVLAPSLHESLAPEMTLALPAAATLADARTLIDPAALKKGTFPEVQGYEVASVLVHDLKFTVRSGSPGILAQAIAREGILSDALGNYTSAAGRGELVITYTGPLLSDDLVELVRRGIARRAATTPGAVAVSARSATGVGVDMAKEPALAPQPRAAQVATAHSHGAVAPAVALPAVAEGSSSSLWDVSVVAVAVLLTLTLVLLLRTRFKLEQPEGELS